MQAVISVPFAHLKAFLKAISAAVYCQPVTKQDRADRMLADWQRELPEVVSRELGLVKRVGRLAALVEASTAAALAPHRLTYAEFDVLATLRREPPPHELQPRDLAARSSLTTGGTSNILKRLVDAGLVERQPHEHDRRASVVRLTTEGKRTAEDIARATREAHTRLFRNIAPAELRELDRRLRGVLLEIDDW
jgi:DNA-binding MarR family transcriptional regulator